MFKNLKIGKNHLRINKWTYIRLHTSRLLFQNSTLFLKLILYRKLLLFKSTYCLDLLRFLSLFIELILLLSLSLWKIDSLVRYNAIKEIDFWTSIVNNTWDSYQVYLLKKTPIFLSFIIFITLEMYLLSKQIMNLSF